MGASPSSVRMILGPLGYPGRRLSGGGACDGVVAANAFIVAPSRASSARSTPLVPWDAPQRRGTSVS